MKHKKTKTVVMAASTTAVRPYEIVQSAISRGDVNKVRHLLDNGASPNERGRHDTTALHWAAAAGHLACSWTEVRPFPLSTFRLPDCPYSSCEGSITTRRAHSLGLLPRLFT